MAHISPIELGVSVRPTLTLGPDTFTNIGPLSSQGGTHRAFGGYVVSQAIAAAARTVPKGYVITNSQSSFLESANIENSILYKVERTFDGRTFLTRTVHAMQEDRLLYIALVNFQNTNAPSGVVLNYQASYPEIGDSHPDQDGIMCFREFIRLMMSPQRSSRKYDIETDMANVDWRIISIDNLSDEPSDTILRLFGRTGPISTQESTIHLAALAYLTEEFAPAAAIAANTKQTGEYMLNNIAMAVSLTHNISFHDHQAKADQWVLAERRSSWAAGGRILLQQNVWNVQSKKLIVSVSHEVLMRLGTSRL